MKLQYLKRPRVRQVGVSGQKLSTAPGFEVRPLIMIETILNVQCQNIFHPSSWEPISVYASRVRSTGDFPSWTDFSDSSPLGDVSGLAARKPHHFSDSLGADFWCFAFRLEAGHARIRSDLSRIGELIWFP